MKIFKMFGKAKGSNNTENEASEEQIKIYITHLGGHRINPYELMKNKKAQELIHKMAQIRVTEKRKLRKASAYNKSKNRSN